MGALEGCPTIGITESENLRVDDALGGKTLRTYLHWGTELPFLSQNLDPQDLSRMGFHGLGNPPELELNYGVGSVLFSGPLFSHETASLTFISGFHAKDQLSFSRGSFGSDF